MKSRELKYFFGDIGWVLLRIFCKYIKLWNVERRNLGNFKFKVYEEDNFYVGIGKLVFFIWN